MADPWDDPAARAWRKRANEELRPMIQGSAYTIGLISDGEPDAKQAVEIGFMLLLEKPIILVVVPGARVPAKLALIADDIVEFGTDDEMQGRLAEAIRRIEERGSPS